MIVRHSTAAARMPHLPINAFVAFLLLMNAATWLPVAQAEHERHLRVSEMAPVGHQIGYVTDKLPEMLDRSNFFIVFPESESMAEKILAVNEKTGEVLLQAEADYEKETKLIFLAVPTDGSLTIKVTVEILDENDNTPEFPVKDINLEISEYARIDTELVLPSAVDPDSERYAIKKYFIAGGNVNNVFRLATSKLNNAMYVDLVVNGQLDREYRDRYDLVVEAIDGGEPAKRGRLNVHVIILDANDNAPEFLHSRYSAQITSNATIGAKVITVKARDADTGENARITYRLAENQFNTQGIIPFKINSESGDIIVDSSPLNPGSTFELIVIASDHGVPQPLESTVFVTINVESSSAGASKYDLNIVWLTEDGSARISENLPLGYILARISVRDYGSESLHLKGVDSLCLKQTDIPSVYLVLVCGPIDRELTPELHIQFSLSSSNEDIILDHPIIVEILDVNDNPPKWNNTEFSVIFNRQSEKQPQSVYRFIAEDADSGENARIRYSLDSNDFFDIESETGILFAKNEIDCQIGNEISFDVIASDNGEPSLNSSVKVIVNVIDTDSKPPIFEKSLYEITTKEDAEISTCLLQVIAHDNTCGTTHSNNNNNKNNNKVHYSFKESSDNEIFKLDSLTGKICLQKSLDYENVSRYQLTIFATNSAERSSTTLVNILIEDVNDNSPIFVPETYNITVYEDLPIGTALLSVHAIDEDQGKFGEVHYKIESDNTFFHIDSHNGKLYSDKPLFSFAGQTINIKVIAKDSGGLTSQTPANIEVQILPAEVDCPHFVRGLYEFTISEDILPGIVIGTVEAISSRALSYRIISGNNGKFQLDSKSGKLIVSKEQDADKSDIVLLNIEARASDNCASFSQIKIRIHDTNDNAPEFDMPEVETNVAENFPIHEPFFAVQAVDKDKHENGKVTYELIKSEPICPVIVRPLTGQLLLAAPLDYEKIKRYKITIRAQDQGIPPKASMAVVNLNVLDNNDNAPEFENQLYDFEVAEDASLMTSIGFVKATDKDSDLNAEITYRFVDERVADFGINSKTGELFIRQTLDRELKQDYSFIVLAEDKGNPPLSSNASIHVRILDINDNTPNCTNISKLRVSEYLSPKEIIGQIEAFDPDAGLNGTVVYRLQQTNEFFDIKRTGEIILQKRLRQGIFKSPFQLAVIAEDQGPRPRPAVCIVIIELDETKSDVELLEPVDRTIKINANDEPGIKLVDIKASNAQHWNIEKSGISDYFAINNGTITLNQHPDEQKFEKPQPLSVAIADAQGRKRYLSFIIRLHHLSTPDNETIVTRVKETTAIGTKLLTLSQPQRALTDSYYSLIKNNPSFEIDEKSGSVYLARRLDYNNASMVQMKIQKQNLNAANKKEMTLIFELDDSNNHSPKFSTNNYTFEVLENTVIGINIGRVEASDEDEGTNGIVKYRILGENKDFTIDIKTGEIFLQKTLHFHVKRNYVFVVEAEDSAVQASDRRRSQCTVFINVIDTNDNSPVFKSAQEIIIRWASIFNFSQPIHYFVATDVDSSELIVYKIISGNSNAFFLNQTTGTLYLRENIEENTKLTIRASDNSLTPRFTDQQFSIFVEHNSIEWSFFEKPAFNFKLPSSPIPGSVVNNFLQNDNRGGIKFGLFAPQKPLYFQIGETDGILRISGAIKNGIYRLIVFATSLSANATDYASVVVNIGSSIYEGPKINQNSCGNITIRENMAIPNVMQIFAYHEINETDNPFFYHIEGGADGLFAINETNGMISCKELDRENKSEHFLIISVSDNNMPKRADVCTVRVMVADENDNAPIFSSTILQIIEISDLIQAPSLLLKFSATDADEGDNGVVKYYIKDDPSGSLDIDPDNGDLIFARDYSFPKSEFILIVAAEDYGNKVVKRSEQKLRILWKRSTKGFLRGEPKFLQQKYITYVAEGLPKNTKVMKIETSNKIFTDVPLTLSIMEGNYDSAFTIDDENYLRTAEELDAEIQTLYTLKVVATGKFVKSAETIIEIRVLDVNDNAPSFPPIKDRQISENLPVGSHVTTVMANDVDADVDLEYMINPPNDYFYIGRFTGAIYLKEPLDYEMAKTINVGIQVFDGVHIVKTNFTVTVVDVNDNPPKFTSDLYKFKVSTNSAKNDIIGKVSANDPDEGSNGEFRYEFLNDSENLRIDSKSGELRLKAPLKEGMVYFAPIKAVDRGNPKLSSFAMVQIQFVQNIVQQIAEFKKPKYSFLVAENYPLYLPFGQIDLKNQSSISYESVNFQILDKSYADIFHLNNNGQFLLLQKIDFEAVKEYRFRIGLIIDENGVTNTSKPKSTATVIVKISDVNDNAPIFNDDATKIIKIDEQMKKGAILGRLTATDLDAADNARIQFSILDGNQRGIIRVDSNSGAIIYDHWDDEELYENPGVNTFNLTFMATDNGSPPLWNVHSAQLVLNIDTWSGSAPMFAVPVYHKYIFENSAIGSVILKAQAHNKWDYLGNNWRYSISDNDEIFTIESHTGEVFLKGDLDYEKRHNYEFMVTVKDARHRSAVVPVEITIIGVDEFAPVFSKSSYTFEIPINAEVGQRIGNVFATDDDVGPDGKVYYSIPDDQYISFIGIDPDTGVLVLREPVPVNKSIEQITVIASSGLTQHSRATVYLEVASSNTVKATNIFGMNALNKYIIIVALLFFVLLTLLCCIVFCIYFRSKNRKKKPQKQIYSVAKGNVAVMADINRMSPSYGKLVPSMSYERTKTFSLISSNSSDRNSNLFKSTHTDGFGVRSQPDSGIDPDALSISSSVTDYLLQIGVTPTKLDPTQLHQLSILGRPIPSSHDRLDPELSELIYAKVDDILAPGSRINVNNATYDIPLLSASSLIQFSVEQENSRRAPTFQPLTEVFSQISRMKNEQNAATVTTTNQS